MNKPNPSTPFFYGGPTPHSHFVGRETEIHTIFDQIANRSHAALYGESGIGTSSILRYIEVSEAWHEHGVDRSKAVVVYLNCRLGEPFTAHLFWEEILTQLHDKIEAENPLRCEINSVLSQEKITGRNFRRVLRDIGKNDKFLVLLLDDFDAAFETHDGYSETQMCAFLDGLRNLAVHNPDGHLLSVIVVTFKPLNEAGPTLRPGRGSPWYNHYLFQPVRHFDNKEVNALLDKMPEEYGFSPQEVQYIRRIAGGHPCLLQLASQLIYRKRSEGRLIDYAQITREFEAHARQHFSGFWQNSSDVERMLLMLIALNRLEGRLNRKRRYDLGNLDLIFRQYERELRDLLDRRNLIKFGRGRYTYDIFSPIMEWWVIQEIENSSDENELEQRQLVLFNFLSRRQAEQIRNVIKSVWERKDAIASGAKWVGKYFGKK